MSAQVIAALRRRAELLGAEAMRVHVHGEKPPASSGGHPRSAGSLFFLAGEFRKLADEAEALDPQAGTGTEPA